MTARWELVAKSTEFLAEEMGVALKRSALSPNIRERMDHSTAVLSARGAIAAQAEHIPVHLGSFAVGVRALLAEIDRQRTPLRPHEMVLVNDPYVSGTHLNDLMLLAPVFYRDRLSAYVVNKAHHVDVGGPVPGSLNPEAQDLYGEGAVLPPARFAAGDLSQLPVWRTFAANVRDPASSWGDLQAQIAANRLGLDRVRRLFDRYGRASVEAAWSEAQRTTRRRVERILRRLPQIRVTSEDFLELGDRRLRVRASLRVAGGSVEVDFDGTDRQVPAPLNAVFGVTFSASSYATRAVLPSDLPTNQGLYDSLRVRAPEGSLVHPRRPAAVSGGNVETSQRIADVVLGALGKVVPEPLPANSSGTMFNLMMGSRGPAGPAWAYYETIGGGSGARPNGPGVSGVHTHMTNTLNTPVEVVEKEYPVRFHRYSIRTGSGGDGRYRGGDGIVRSFELLEATRLSLIADRFLLPPAGREGGRPGSGGRASVRRGHRWFRPGSKFTLDLERGDEVVLETPGGGGFGPASRSRKSRRAAPELRVRRRGRKAR